MSEQPVVKRLHISGLTPTITPEHLRDRFKSFGTVLDLEAPGPNAFGEPRSFVYLDIETTPAQLRKCLNIMSGAHWRGAQLRLAEAKPRFDERYAADAAPSAEDEARRARKKLRRAEAIVGGKHAQDMRPVAAPRGKFWKLEGGHLVRPLAMRPSHPLPPALASAAKEKLEPRRPMRRMPRRVLDPARWGAQHELFPDDLEVSREEEWEWESADSDEEEEEVEGRVLLGYWTRGDERSAVYGRVERTEMEDLYATSGSESDLDAPIFPARDGSTSPLFQSRRRSASPLFPTRAERERSASPLFPTRTGRERSASPLFPTRTDRERSASPLFPSRPADEGAGETSSRPSSPLFPARTEARSGSSSPLFPSRS